MSPDDLRKNLESKQQTEQKQEPPKPQDSSESSEEPEQQVNDAPDNNESEDEEVQQYKKLAMNTFGFTEDEIDEKVVKMAKSFKEAQSTMTKSRQEALQNKQIIDGLNQVFEKSPELYEQVKAIAQGKQPENLSTNGNHKADNPQQSVGQLDTTGDIDEDTLISKGYLKAEEIEGLDDLAKARKIAKAELAYEKDAYKQQFRNELKEEQENLRKEQELQEAKTLNKQRVESGWDSYITNYGVNLADVTDEQLQTIQSQLQYVADPSNPNLIAEDAVEIVANRVLGNTLADKKGVQTGQRNLSDIEDTGVSVSKGSKPNQNLTKAQKMDQELKKRAYENFAKTANPIAYKQKYKMN